MQGYYLGLGGNIGSIEENLLKTISILQENGSILKALSSPYKTPPWGEKNQDWFLNACCLILFEKRPEELLSLTQNVEIQLKRKREKKWGPRTVDIDILALQSGQIYNQKNLKIPHPFLLERAFVLTPLSEIAPNFQMKGKNIKTWSEMQKDTEIIKLKPSKEWQKLMDSTKLQ